eukprot:Stramenopile-MAST_4_protein_2053
MTDKENVGGSSTASGLAAVSHWRWAQKHAEMEEQHACIQNMLDDPVAGVTQRLRTDALRSPLDDTGRGVLRQRRSPSPVKGEHGSGKGSRSGGGEAVLPTGRRSLAELFPTQGFAHPVAQALSPEKEPGEEGCPSSSAGNALGQLRAQLVDEMGDEVWLEVKEQEDGWNWDEPVVSRSESLRPSNALNEDQYDFAIVLKNNLDDRTATAVREKRRLWKLNQKKDETSTAQPDTEPSDEDSDDHNGDEDEEGSDAAKNFMRSLQGRRRENRQKARYKEEDDDFKHGGAPESAAGEDDAGDRPASFFAPVRLDGSKTLRAVVTRLRAAGLFVKRLKSLDGKETLLKIRAPQDRLEQEAERMKLTMRTRQGKWLEFRVSRRDEFCGAGYAGVLFRSSDRQSIIHNIIKLPKRLQGAGLGPESPYAPSIASMFPLHMHARLRGLRNSWVKFWSEPLPSRFTLTAVEAVNHYDLEPRAGIASGVCARVQRSVYNLSLFGLLNQPLDAIAEYFGENVAFYFAWLQFYTKWLIIPALAGLGLFILQIRAGTIDHPLLPFYSMFLAVWASFFLLYWRRRSNELAYRWGVLHHEEAEVSRPEFYGEARRSEVTGEWELHYPAWRRLLKQAMGFPISAVWLAGILVGMVALFDLRDNLMEQLSGKGPLATASKLNATVVVVPAKGERPNAFLQFGYSSDSERMSLDMYDQSHYGDVSFWVYLLLPPLTYGFMIPALDAVYKMVAKCLNRWENHRTESDYQNSLITKVVLFKLINAFCSLYYLAFSGRHPILRLTAQLASFMIAGQILNNTQEIVLPCVKVRAKTFLAKRRLAKAVEAASLSKRRIRQATSTSWDEARMPVYDTFADYAEMTVQFGYITFFSLAFPLAPLCALVNNLIELRSDAYKLCYNMQRPVARKAGGIGVWFPILQTMVVFAVMTNLAIIGFTTRQLEYYFPSWSSAEKMFAVFLFEHVVIVTVYLINLIIPPLPHWIAVEVAKDAYKLQSQNMEQTPHHVPVGE